MLRFSLNKEAKETLLSPQNQAIMIIGGPDTGKTALAEDLMNLLLDKFKIAVVDADIGQSHLGPPTTIAWGMLEKKFDGWKNIPVRDMYFVGTTSPFGNLLPMLTGIKIICDIAKQRAEKIIIDTTGMIKGGAGRALKICKIDIIHPQIILALESKDELEPIILAFKGMRVPLIFRIPVSTKAGQKLHPHRAGYRERKFRDYFKDAHRIILSREKIGLRNIKLEGSSLGNYLISLRDRESRDLALGIIDEVDEKEGKIGVFTPLNTPKEIGGVVLGGLKITREGRQLP
ncbi:MAG: Clp1/GlmU family protein [Candidatus Aerophobetes bacterium]|nr:Clp1/GlmU family protein [Candidatus Aerophobetes bacterium]